MNKISKMFMVCFVMVATLISGCAQTDGELLYSVSRGVDFPLYNSTQTVAEQRALDNMVLHPEAEMSLAVMLSPGRGCNMTRTVGFFVHQTGAGREGWRLRGGDPRCADGILVNPNPTHPSNYVTVEIRSTSLNVPMVTYDVRLVN